MKKSWVKRCAATGLCGALLLTGACGKATGNTLDTDKTQIYINVYDGGTGTDWIKQEATRFNANQEDYEIVIEGEKRSDQTIRAEVVGGTGKYSAYFTVGAVWQDFIYRDRLVDLSGILERKTEGEERTIGSKLKEPELWKQVGSKNGQGQYLLPYADSMTGLVFDYDQFVQNGWLTKLKGNDESAKSALTEQGIVFEVNAAKNELRFVSADHEVNYEAGDPILSAGKDGKYGTYDDGQPQTFAEFDAMLTRILATNGAKPFVYPSTMTTYVDDIVYAYFYQLAGEDATKALFQYDSNGVALPMKDGSSKVIALENGYEVYGMQAIYDTLEFAEKYFNNSAYLHNSLNGATNHKDAQRNFLYGFTDEYMDSAMLLEGVWWENEARPTFDAVSRIDSNRGYGKVEYRYMLLPEIPGQKGIAGNEKGTVFATKDTGSFFVVKEKDTKKTEILLDFLTQTLSDRALRNFTSLTGIPRMFEYEMTAEDYARMTPFAKNAYQIYNDTENVKIVRQYLERYREPLYSLTSLATWAIFPFNDAGIVTGKPLLGLINNAKVLSPSDPLGSVFDGISGAYSASDWEDYLAEARRLGFYA